MSFDSLNNKLLKIDSIQQINEGLTVMKHFFELSKKLLPIYFDLKIKSEKVFQDYLNIERINEVYNSYNFNVKASKVLLNSDILDYIKQAYFVIQNDSNSIEEKQLALNLFLKEYDRLIKKWQFINTN